MKSRQVALAIIAYASLALLLAGCNSSKSIQSNGASVGGVDTEEPLLFSVTQSLGVSREQGIAGVGAILSLAQSRLDASDFDQVKSAIPAADSYIYGARDLAVASSPINDMSALNAAFGRASIGPTTGSKMISAVTQYVTEVGGESIGRSFNSVFQ